jgi:hypothetical protein
MTTPMRPEDVKNRSWGRSVVVVLAIDTESLEGIVGEWEG